MKMMYNMVEDTFTFKECIVDIIHFKLKLSIYTSLDGKDIYHDVLYRYLYQRYANSQIAYETQEAFCNNFLLTYENHFKQFKKRASVLESIYGLDNNQLLTASQAVTNFALNNNELTKDPLNNIIEYVSEQQTSRQISDIFYKLTNVIENLQDNYIFDFLNKFNIHFLRIFSDNIVLYKKEF